MGSSEAFEAGGESVEHLIVVSSILEHVAHLIWARLGDVADRMVRWP